MEDDLDSAEYTWTSASTIPTSGLRKLVWPDGYVYKGQVDDRSRPHGYGRLTGKNGAAYYGTWVNGKAHGEGVFLTPEGDKYEGAVSDHAKNGYGRMTARNGTVYTGYWCNDKPHGQGRSLNFDGSEYEGQWAEGFPHGKGVLKVPSWGSYTGNFDQGTKQGYGRVVYDDGEEYCGYWMSDTPNGEGTYKWKDGSVYDGMFEHGAMCYNGTYRSATSVFEGVWKNNIRNGYGRLAFLDGAAYEGEWVDDAPQGRGRFVNKEGVMFEGVFVKGTFDPALSGMDERGVCTLVAQHSETEMKSGGDDFVVSQPVPQPGDDTDTVYKLPKIPLPATREFKFKTLVFPKNCPHLDLGYTFDTTLLVEPIISRSSDVEKSMKKTSCQETSSVLSSSFRKLSSKVSLEVGMKGKQKQETEAGSHRVDSDDQPSRPGAFEIPQSPRNQIDADGNMNEQGELTPEVDKKQAPCPQETNCASSNAGREAGRALTNSEGAQKGNIISTGSLKGTAAEIGELSGNQAGALDQKATVSDNETGENTESLTGENGIEEATDCVAPKLPTTVKKTVTSSGGTTTGCVQVEINDNTSRRVEVEHTAYESDHEPQGAAHISVKGTEVGKIDIYIKIDIEDKRRTRRRRVHRSSLIVNNNVTTYNTSSPPAASTEPVKLPVTPLTASTQTGTPAKAFESEGAESPIIAPVTGPVHTPLANRTEIRCDDLRLDGLQSSFEGEDVGEKIYDKTVMHRTPPNEPNAHTIRALDSEALSWQQAYVLEDNGQKGDPGHKGDLWQGLDDQTPTFRPTVKKVSESHEIIDIEWTKPGHHSVSIPITITTPKSKRFVPRVPDTYESIQKVDLSIPKAQQHSIKTDYPLQHAFSSKVYCPRIVEVPIPAEYLSSEGLHLCNKIQEEVKAYDDYIIGHTSGAKPFTRNSIHVTTGCVRPGTSNKFISQRAASFSAGKTSFSRKALSGKIVDDFAERISKLTNLSAQVFGSHINPLQEPKVLF